MMRELKMPVVLLFFTTLTTTGGSLEAQEWIKFEMIEASALPIVRTNINGMGDHRLVVDVGFNDLLLDTLLVDGSGMKLVERGELQEIDYYGKEESVSVAYAPTLELGKAKFELVRTLLIDGEDGTGAGGIRSYGRIGRDILEPLRLTIYYPRQLLMLEPSPETEVPPGSVSFTSEGRFLYIPVKLEMDGVVHEANFVLDPGTSGSVLDRHWATDVKLAGKKDPEATLSVVEIGGFRREQVPILLGDMPALPYDGSPVGVIGADVLRTISVTYDFARDLVWLTELGDDAS